MTRATTALAALIAATGLALSSPPAQAGAFFAWEVTDVPWGDVLNARKWPASHSQKQTAYPNSTVLSMTGRCKGAPDLLGRITALDDVRQRQVVRYRWCEIWHDPARNGRYTTGWVYMKYMKPAR